MACCGSQAVPRSVSTAAPSLSRRVRAAPNGGAAAAPTYNIRPPSESHDDVVGWHMPSNYKATYFIRTQGLFLNGQRPPSADRRPGTSGVDVSFGSVRALSGPYRFTFFFLPLPLLAAPGSSPLLGRSARCGGAASTSAHGSKPMV